MFFLVPDSHMLALLFVLRVWFGFAVSVARRTGYFCFVWFGLRFGPQDSLHHEMFASDSSHGYLLKPGCRVENRVLESGSAGF